MSPWWQGFFWGINIMWVAFTVTMITTLLTQDYIRSKHK